MEVWAVPLSILVRATLLLLAAAGVAGLLRRRSAATRHAAWSFGLLGILALPIVMSLTPRVPLSVPQRPEVVVDAEPPAVVPATAAAALASEVLVSRTPAPAVIPRSGSLPWVVGVTWLVGVIVVLGRFGASLLSALRLALSARFLRDLGPARLATSDRVRVPMTFGALRPVVLVPSGFAEWSEERREEVLAHELAHVRRRDWLVQALARLAVAALWFHPLAWHALRRLRAEAELAADDSVLARGAVASSYASHLLDIVRTLDPSRETPLMTLSMASGPLEPRVLAILDPHRERGPAPRAVRTAVAAVLGVALLAVSAVDVRAQERHESPWQHVKRMVKAHHRAWTTPDTPDEWYERGLQLMMEERHDEGIEAMQEALDAGVKVASASYNVACAHARMGRTDEAFAWLQRAEDAGFDFAAYLHRDPDFASIRRDPRYVRLAERHPSPAADSARKRLEALSRSRGPDAAEWEATGMELFAAGEFTLAAEALAEAFRLAPHSSTVAYNLACAHALSGDRESALTALRLSVEAGWKDAGHARRDGDLHLLRADERFEKLLRDAELLGGPRTVNVLGWSVGGDDADWDAARERHEAFVAAHPSSGAGWFDLGMSALRTGRHDRAAEAYLKARELKFRPATAAYNVACAHALAGRGDEAFDWLQRAEDEGFAVGAHAASDDDLASLRDDPRFTRWESGTVRTMLRRLVAY